MGDDDTARLIVGAPYYPVASDHRRQVCTQVTAANLPGVCPLCGFYINLHAKVRDNQSLLLRTQVSTEDAFFGLICSAAGAYGALVLDFLNTPVLASGEVSLGHVSHYFRKFRQCSTRRVYSITSILLQEST